MHRLRRELRNEKSDHERFCEKEDYGYSKSKMGEATPCKTSNSLCKPVAREEIIQPSHQSKLSAKLKAYWAAKKTGKK